MLCFLEWKPKTYQREFRNDRRCFSYIFTVHVSTTSSHHSLLGQNRCFIACKKLIASIAFDAQQRSRSREMYPFTPSSTAPKFSIVFHKTSWNRRERGKREISTEKLCDSREYVSNLRSLVRDHTLCREGKKVYIRPNWSAAAARKFDEELLIVKKQINICDITDNVLQHHRKLIS